MLQPAVDHLARRLQYHKRSWLLGWLAAAPPRGHSRAAGFASPAGRASPARSQSRARLLVLRGRVVHIDGRFERSRTLNATGGERLASRESLSVRWRRNLAMSPSSCDTTHSRSERGKENAKASPWSSPPNGQRGERPGKAQMSSGPIFALPTPPPKLNTMCRRCR